MTTPASVPYDPFPPRRPVQSQPLAGSAPSSENHSTLPPLTRAEPTSFYSQPVTSSLSNPTPYDPPRAPGRRGLLLRPIQTTNLANPHSRTRRPVSPPPPRSRSPSTSSLFSRLRTSKLVSTFAGPVNEPGPAPFSTYAFISHAVNPVPPLSPPESSSQVALPLASSPPRVRPLPIPLGSRMETGRPEPLPGYFPPAPSAPAPTRRESGE